MQELPPIDLAAVDVMHVLPLGVAFVLGLVARAAHLPPLIGLLAAGFALGAMGLHNTPMLQEISDLGVTLLLFTIGLKLHLRDLAAPVVWLTTTVHMALIIVNVALLVLMGWLLPLAGAGLFELLGIKADLGALALGVLLAGHAETNELAKSLLGFKDLFLIGFFPCIGLSGELSWGALGTALALVVLILPIKTALYFLLMTGQRMRARSATLASLSLTNYSEFGLIVGAIGVSEGMLGNYWLSMLAIALSISFLIAAPLNAASKTLCQRWRHALHPFERRERLPGDEMIRAGQAQVVVFGMGRVGTGAYDYLRSKWGEVVLGIDIDEDCVERHRKAGRNSVHGDATDADFWARAVRSGRGKLALLAFADHEENMAVASLLREQGFNLELASVAHYPDDEQSLRDAGVHAVFNFYASAGESFAEHVEEEFRDLISTEADESARA